MEYPEGWDWLNSIPDEWIPPPEIRGPASSPMINLMIKLLESRIIGNDTIELVGTLIAEKSRFSMWFAVEAKVKVSSNEELARLSLLGHVGARSIYDAWIEYVRAYEKSGGMAISCDQEQSALRDSLLKEISVLSETRRRFGE
jgi:hypothetical protein